MTVRGSIPLASVISLGICLLLAGCVAPEKPKVAAAPPAPKPVAVKPPEDTPIAYLQNVSVVPPTQAIPPAALPPLDPPPQVTERRNAAENEAAPKRRANQPATAHKPPETPAGGLPVAGSSASGNPSPVPPAAALGRAPLVLSDANAPARDALESRINDVRAAAGRIVPSRLNQKQRTTLRRVQSFIKLAEQALVQGELRQASELADRAATLSKALTDGN